MGCKSECQWGSQALLMKPAAGTKHLEQFEQQQYNLPKRRDYCRTFMLDCISLSIKKLTTEGEG